MIVKDVKKITNACHYEKGLVMCLFVFVSVLAQYLINNCKDFIEMFQK